MDKTCRTCKYWKPNWPADRRPESGHWIAGECHRRAPIVNSERVSMCRLRTSWPDTTVDDWCGDWEEYVENE